MCYSPLAETPFLLQKQGFLYKSLVFHRFHAASIAKGGFYIKKEVAVAVEVDLDREVGLGAPLKTRLMRLVRMLLIRLLIKLLIKMLIKLICLIKNIKIIKLRFLVRATIEKYAEILLMK